MNELHELPVAGQVVSAVTLDTNIVICIGDEGEHEIRIETAFTLATIDAETAVRYSPLEPVAARAEGITELAKIITCIVTQGTVSTNGELRLYFGESLRSAPVGHLRVIPDHRYEPWSYSYKNFLLNCPPGGDLSSTLWPRDWP